MAFENTTEVSTAATGNLSDQESRFDKAEKITASTVMIIITVIAIVSNVVVMFVILSTKILRNISANVFIINLCVIDLLASLTAIPFSIITYNVESWHLDYKLPCKLDAFINALFTLASILTVCVISVDRYVSIRLNVHYPNYMTLKRTIGLISYVWIQSMVISSMPLIGWSSYDFSTNKMSCAFIYSDGPSRRSYTHVVLILCFIAPAVIIFVMYFLVFAITRRTTRQIKPAILRSLTHITAITARVALQVHTVEQNLPLAQNRDHTLHNSKITSNAHKTKAQYKAILTLALLTGMFTIFWGPLCTLHLISAIHGRVVVPLRMELFFVWLWNTSYAINPFLYGIMNRTIRERLIHKVRDFMSCARPEFAMDASGSDEDVYQFLNKTSTNNAAHTVSGRRKINDKNRHPDMELSACYSLDALDSKANCDSRVAMTTWNRKTSTVTAPRKISDSIFSVWMESKISKDKRNPQNDNQQTKKCGLKWKNNCGPGAGPGNEETYFNSSVIYCSNDATIDRPFDIKSRTSRTFTENKHEKRTTADMNVVTQSVVENRTSEPHNSDDETDDKSKFPCENRTCEILIDNVVDMYRADGEQENDSSANSHEENARCNHDREPIVLEQTRLSPLIESLTDLSERSIILQKSRHIET